MFVIFFYVNESVFAIATHELLLTLNVEHIFGNHFGRDGAAFQPVEQAV